MRSFFPKTLFKERRFNSVQDLTMIGHMWCSLFYINKLKKTSLSGSSGNLAICSKNFKKSFNISMIDDFIAKNINSTQYIFFFVVIVKIGTIQFLSKIELSM